MLFLQKRAETFRLYYITIFLFQFMWKELIYIGSVRSRNENHLNMTCAKWMNEWMNWQAILKWNKYNCKNIVTEQTYPDLCHPWIVLPDTEQIKDCCFVHFILRQMISCCWVCVFGPSHQPSRLMNKLFGFDIPAVFIIIRVDLQQNTLTTVYLPYARTNYGKFNICFQGPSLWNTIDDNVKLLVSFSISVFKNDRRTNILKDTRGYLLFLTFSFFCTLLPISWILINIFIPYTSCVILCLSIMCADLHVN